MSESNIDNNTENINNIQIATVNFIEPLHVINKNIFESIQDIAVCAICTGVVIEPQQCSKCENCFCKVCVEKWNEKSITCPFKCTDYSLKEPTRVIKRILSKLILKCPKNCNNQLTYTEYLSHIKECTNSIIDCPTCGSKVTESCINKLSYIELQTENKILKRTIEELENKLKIETLSKKGNFRADTPNLEKEFEELHMNDNSIHNKKDFQRNWTRKANPIKNPNVNHNNPKIMYKFSCCNKDYDCFNCHNSHESHRAMEPIALICQDCLFASNNTEDKLCANCGVSFVKEDTHTSITNSAYRVNFIKYKNANRKLNQLNPDDQSGLSPGIYNKKPGVPKFVKKK